MEIAVRYQSRSGNTKKVAEAIAQAAGVQAESVETPLSQPVDLLFVGGAIYAGMLGGKLKKFLKQLPAGQAKKIVVFSTAASESHITPKVAKLLKEQSALLLDKEFHVQSGQLDASLQAAGDFAKETIEQE